MISQSFKYLVAPWFLFCDQQVFGGLVILGFYPGALLFNTDLKKVT